MDRRVAWRRLIYLKPDVRLIFDQARLAKAALVQRRYQISQEGSTWRVQGELYGVPVDLTLVTDDEEVPVVNC